jgi:hypothetical protein
MAEGSVALARARDRNRRRDPMMNHGAIVCRPKGSRRRHRILSPGPREGVRDNKECGGAQSQGATRRRRIRDRFLNPLPAALCPLPSALCPLPSALCPLPSALCPSPHSEHRSGLLPESPRNRGRAWGQFGWVRLRRTLAGHPHASLADPLGISERPDRRPEGCRSAGPSHGQAGGSTGGTHSDGSAEVSYPTI